MRRNNYAKKRKLTKLFVTFAAIAAISYGASVYFNARQTTGDSVVAKINNEKIYKSQIDSKIKEVFAGSDSDIDLPSIDGVQAGFSGASADVLNGNLIFTASVENTSDWVNDGAVLGSFIGVIELDKLQEHYVPQFSMLSKNGEAELLKVESIAVVSSVNKTLKCIIVTDSDGGNSELLKITIEY